MLPNHKQNKIKILNFKSLFFNLSVQHYTLPFQILSAILVLLLCHATYEDDYVVPTFTFQLHDGQPIFRTEGKRSISINEFRASYTVLLNMAVSAAYFFVNLLLYLTIKMLPEDVMYGTILVRASKKTLLCRKNLL